jgi:hypothetical protein
MPTIVIVDEEVAGPRTTGWELEIFEERVRLDELIRRRIHQEVAEHNAGPDGRFRGLVRPGDVADAGRQHIDVEAQCRAAWDAFGRNGCVVLVDDRQVTELDHDVSLHRGSTVTFLKLMPLVGG